MPGSFLQFRFSDAAPTSEEKGLIQAEFDAHDRESGVFYPAEIPLSTLAYHANRLVGAAIGRIWADWLYVSDLWVAKPCRKQGLAAKLLAELEVQAKARNAVGSHTWTASYNAPGFYQKQGYELALELKDKPLGHSSFVCRKYF